MSSSGENGSYWRAASTSALVLSETFVPSRLWSGWRVRWMKRADGCGMEEDVGNGVVDGLNICQSLIDSDV